LERKVAGRAVKRGLCSEEIGFSAPSAQKEDIGAKVIVPSSFSELINAAGFPK
jgi:hypothetical protein